MIESAIGVSAILLRWVIAADLVAGRAATAEAVLGPAAVAAHPAWAAAEADMAVAVCVAVVAVCAVVAVECAVAAEAGGKTS